MDTIDTTPTDFRGATPQNHLAQYVGMLVIGLIIGAGASFAFLKASPVATGNDSYQAGFDAAKKLVLDSSMGGMFQTPDDVRVLQGTVTAISGNQLTLHTQSINPFDDPALADRTVLINASTTVVKLAQKDPKTFQAEMSAFMKATQSGTPQTAPPPQPFTHVPATIADIAVGNVVTISAADNVKTAKSFTASQIQIQQETLPASAPTTASPNQ